MEQKDNIDAGLFLRVSNKDLLYKKEGKTRTYRPVRTVPLNNRNGKSIEERPKEIEKREKKGHWEPDLVEGKQGTKWVILTLVERKSRKSIYVLLPDKSQSSVLKALKRIAKRLKGDDFTGAFKTISMSRYKVRNLLQPFSRGCAPPSRLKKIIGTPPRILV